MLGNAAWIPCVCGEFLCTIHKGLHVSECPCPPVEEWADLDPYVEGSPLRDAPQDLP